MPNGGSDCCGTCWYLVADPNKEEAGQSHADRSIAAICRDFLRSVFLLWWQPDAARPLPADGSIGPVAGVCTIRDLPIKSPFYTYCANHPKRSLERDLIPIGPVFTGNSSGHREFWRPSPDTDEVRRHLLDLLARMPEPPATEYPIGHRRDEVVIWQLGEFRESRAVEELRRIAAFDPTARDSGPFAYHPQRLVVLAREALSKIEADA